MKADGADLRRAASDNGQVGEEERNGTEWKWKLEGEANRRKKEENGRQKLKRGEDWKEQKECEKRGRREVQIVSKFELL